MRKHEIWEYVSRTPYNTNPAILYQFLDEFTERAINPLYNYTLSVDKTTDLFGLKADDLQTGVTFNDGIAHGTLHYVTDYTGFSGKEEERSGHYFTFKVTNDDADTIKVNGSTLDSDGIIVLIMKKGGKVKIELTADNETVEDYIDVTNLIFE